jgi:hypothetical protein
MKGTLVPSDISVAESWIRQLAPPLRMASKNSPFGVFVKPAVLSDSTGLLVEVEVGAGVGGKL